MIDGTPGLQRLSLPAHTSAAYGVIGDNARLHINGNNQSWGIYIVWGFINGKRVCFFLVILGSIGALLVGKIANTLAHSSGNIMLNVITAVDTINAFVLGDKLPARNLITALADGTASGAQKAQAAADERTRAGPLWKSSSQRGGEAGGKASVAKLRYLPGLISVNEAAIVEYPQEPALLANRIVLADALLKCDGERGARLKERAMQRDLVDSAWAVAYALRGVDLSALAGAVAIEKRANREKAARSAGGKAVAAKRRELEESGPKPKCTSCEAEVTRQWRSGPMGPRTLCDTCGQRWKKKGQA
jgi:hypothetical protein